MAGGAIIQGLNLPVRNVLLAPFLLLLRGELRVRIPFPIKISDFVRRPDMHRRVAMAIEAKSHVKWLRLGDFLHFIDLAMTLDTTDATRDMDGMIEVNVIRSAVNLHPRNRLTGRSALSNQR